jgi:radical SAM protein with 4Fe4S-binding SPASM domain
MTRPQYSRQQQLDKYQQQYDVIGVIDLDLWFQQVDYARGPWLKNQLVQVHRDCYADNQRIICTLTQYNPADDTLLKELKYYLNHVDITNFFVILLINHPDSVAVKQIFNKNNLNTTSVTIDIFQEDSVNTDTKTTPVDKKIDYCYNSNVPLKIAIDQLNQREEYLLTQSEKFCIYPWIHLHAYPTGQAYPCCGAEMRHSVGNTQNNTLEEIWNSEEQRRLRRNMLSEQSSLACNRCYEQEAAGFFSMRKSANKHHGHHIARIHATKPDGQLDQFSMIYWDIRFSNLCNLSCRSCGHIFSSSWYQDQVKLAGADWKAKNKVLNYAGRTETDIWEQLIPHLDYVEQIYFAGGEPLMMEEHYNILDELERRGRFDVRLIYNTNFTHTKLKDRTVFDYWRKFESVAVGASLDAMGPRAEYIRKGTAWDRVEHNRRTMQQVCPDVDFYISPTLSILNAMHLPDFHREWTEKGLIRAQDLNVNILQDPAHLRIDIATEEYKDQIVAKYQDHLAWLRPQDLLNRATVGFESAVNFMQAIDNTQLIKTFWAKTQELDHIRNENLLDVIPELGALR